jgi:ketosteroid isomerase-like protein
MRGRLLAMALDKEALVRGALAAFARRDFDALLELCTDDVELRSAIIGGADGSAYRGHAEMRSWRTRCWRPSR